jgi:hypothetical protein
VGENSDNHNIWGGLGNGSGGGGGGVLVGRRKPW